MSILACKIILVELALPCLAGLASITESHLADLISRSQQRVVGCQETAKKNRWGCDCQGHFVFFLIQAGFSHRGNIFSPFSSAFISWDVLCSTLVWYSHGSQSIGAPHWFD